MTSFGCGEESHNRKGVASGGTSEGGYGQAVSPSRIREAIMEWKSG
jgi:hypothetical protein